MVAHWSFLGPSGQRLPGTASLLTTPLSLLCRSINTGNIEVTSTRYPQPGSRAESYAKPASKASDPAQNYYYSRDARRDYPKTHYVSQERLASLLLSEPGRPETLGCDLIMPLHLNDARLTPTFGPVFLFCFDRLPNPSIAEADAKALVSSEQAPSLSALYVGEASAAPFFGQSKLP